VSASASLAGEPLPRRLAKRVIRAYMRLWPELELHGREHVPPRGPLLVFTNHASILDTPAIMAVDPYPNTTMVAKASMFRVPLVGGILRARSAIPVDRRGHDVASVRALLAALRRGQPVAVAPEGHRSTTGRLTPINPTLARLAVRADVPILPIGIAGSFDALPPGARFPRRRKIVLRVGPAFRLDRSLSEREAASRIGQAIAALLPPAQRPAG